MAQHVTIVLANNQAIHHHGEVMFDAEEGILVIDLLEVEGTTAHYPVKEGYIVSWITSEMSPEEEHLRREAAADARRAAADAALEEGTNGLDH